MKIFRYISAFEKDDDLACSRINFKILPSLSQLQKIVNAEASDLLYEEIDLTDKELVQLESYAHGEFNSNKYSYCLSCEQADD